MGFPAHCCKHLVPRLCLGTHGVGGSAGWKRGRTLRAVGYEAEPRHQVLGVFFPNLKTQDVYSSGFPACYKSNGQKCPSYETIEQTMVGRHLLSASLSHLAM